MIGAAFSKCSRGGDNRTQSWGSYPGNILWMQHQIIDFKSVNCFPTELWQKSVLCPNEGAVSTFSEEVFSLVSVFCLNIPCLDLAYYMET